MGIAKSIYELIRAQKRTQLFNTARIITERLRSELKAKPYSYFQSININDLYMNNATCDLNGHCSFDIDNCYLESRFSSRRKCLPTFHCTFCFQNSKLISTNNVTCAYGYQFDVGFNIVRIVSDLGEVGYGVCLRVSFKEPGSENILDYRVPVVIGF